ncbi:MAG TPA: hypothetical protein PLJ20_11375, partial [Candidatus Contendobacter sp.]|nr:hypothetical protein [Candidatus Contendobacter sp.]
MNPWLNSPGPNCITTVSMPVPGSPEPAALCIRFGSRYQPPGLVSCVVYSQPPIPHDPIHFHHRRRGLLAR